VNKQSTHKYTESEISSIIDKTKNPQPTTQPKQDYGKLYNAAAGIALNPEKRKRFKYICMLALLALVVGLVFLGVFVSWQAAVIITSILVGIVVLFAVSMFILFKTGLAEKIMEKHGF
jgi:uncharacterized membrane protein (DUF485 family)